MRILETPFKGLFILEPKVFDDSRGFFMESYNAKALIDAGLLAEFVQDNHSSSAAGVLRGLHFQNEPFAQTKLVRVLSGTILDVVVDLRRDQSTFGKHYAIELDAKSKRQLYVPKGFAHGFSVIGNQQAEILYKCDKYYHKDSEGGILYNDPALGIDWGLKENDIILSEKDKVNPTLSLSKFNF